ncbi:hypothetical protein ACLMJK_007786 [Lecanora helva]
MGSEQKVIKKEGVWTVDGRPREKIEFLSQKTSSNIPGKLIITLLVTLPPNTATPPHRHNGAAVTGLVIKGTTLNQMNDDEPFESSAGETFFEAPGCHHRRGENNTDQECQFFALFVIDEKTVLEGGPESLMQLDADQEETS